MPGKQPAKTRSARSRTPSAEVGSTEKQPAIAALARRHAEAALAALIEVVGDRTVSPAARISAASALLNWGFGKSNPSGDEGGECPTELVIRWRNAQDGPLTRHAPRPKS
jgi:hypothetical protein